MAKQSTQSDYVTHIRAAYNDKYTPTERDTFMWSSICNLKSYSVYSTLIHSLPLTEHGDCKQMPSTWSEQTRQTNEKLHIHVHINGSVQHNVASFYSYLAVPI